jgi:hypothetical protein
VPSSTRNLAVACFSFLGVFLLELTPLAATSASAQRVLILDSFSHDLAPVDSATSIFRTTLTVRAAPVYDWRSVDRWGISEPSLPSDSNVWFRPQLMWEQHKWLIIMFLALSLIEAILIDILLRERRRGRLAQRELEDRLRFEQLVSALSGTFVNLSPAKIEAQIIEALGQIASFLRFDIAALSVFTGRGTEGRVAFNC